MNTSELWTQDPVTKETNNAMIYSSTVGTVRITTGTRKPSQLYYTVHIFQSGRANLSPVYQSRTHLANMKPFKVSTLYSTSDSLHQP